MTVCLSVRGRMPTLLHGPRCNLGNGRKCPLVVHYWKELQSVLGLRCYDNIYSANAKCQRVLVLALCQVLFVTSITPERSSVSSPLFPLSSPSIGCRYCRWSGGVTHRTLFRKVAYDFVRSGGILCRFIHLSFAILVNKTFVSQTPYGAPPRITLGEFRPGVPAFAKS